MASPKSKTTGRTTPKGTSPAARTKPKKGVTAAKAWKSSARTPVELELPSGNVCRVINRGMKTFIDEGAIPNSLLPIVQAAITGAESGSKPEAALAKAAGDENMLTDMLSMVDTVFVSCVQEPEVLAAPMAVVHDGKDEEGNLKTKTVVVDVGRPVTDVDGDVIERDPDCLYVDEIDLEDKMFLFQWAVGGTDSVEQFRTQFAATMDDLSSGEGVEQEA